MLHPKNSQSYLNLKVVGVMALLGVKRETSQTQPSLAIKPRTVILPEFVRCLKNIFYIHAYIGMRLYTQGN